MKMGARAQDKRLWLGGGAVLAVLIVLIGWFVVIDPELSAASSTRDQADSAQLQNMVLEAKNSTLKAAERRRRRVAGGPGRRIGRTALRRRAPRVHPPAFRAGDGDFGRSGQRHRRHRRTRATAGDTTDTAATTDTGTTATPTAIPTAESAGAWCR